MKRTIIWTILVATILSACKKDSIDPLIIHVTPSDIHIYADPGEVLTFNVSVSSEHELTLFQITTKQSNSFTQTVKDSLLSQMQFSYSFEYQVPSIQDTSIQLSFLAFDNEGNEKTATRLLIFNSNPNTLAETSGHVLYSTPSQKEDGYNIHTGTSQHLATSLDTTINIAEYRNDTTIADTILTKSWYSRAGTQFVKFNGFDYANATDYSTMVAFSSGNKFDIITNIISGDIILSNYFVDEAEKYAVIKITGVFEEEGSENDRYEFKLKK